MKTKVIFNPIDDGIFEIHANNVFLGHLFQNGEKDEWWSDTLWTTDGSPFGLPATNEWGVDVNRAMRKVTEYILENVKF